MSISGCLSVTPSLTFATEVIFCYSPEFCQRWRIGLQSSRSWTTSRLWLSLSSSCFKITRWFALKWSPLFLVRLRCCLVHFYLLERYCHQQVLLLSLFDISVTRSLRVKRNCGIFLLLILFFSLRLSSYLGTRCDKGVHFRTRVCVLGVRDTVTKYRCGRSFVLRQIPETEVNAQYILRKPSKLWIYCIFPVNWCQHWFEFFPNPPINVLSLTENILGYHDKELLQHFVKYEVTTQVSSWSSPLCCFYLIIDFLVCSVSKPVTIPFAGNSGAIPKVWGCNILTLSEQQSFCLGPASQSTKRQDVL